MFGVGTFVGLLSLDGTLLEANRMALAAADPHADDALGRPFWEATWWAWNLTVQQRLRDAVQRAATGEVVRYDETVQVSDGGLIAIDFTLVPLVEGGRVAALVSSAIDVTERQLAETRTRALAAFTRRLSAASNVHQIVTLVAESGPAVLHAATCRVALWDRDRSLLRVADQDLLRDRARVDPALDLKTRTPAGDAALSAATIVVGDTATDHEYGHLTAGWAATTTLAMAAAPLRTAPGSVLTGEPEDLLGDVLGVLEVTWTSPVSLDPAHVASLDTMADICGQGTAESIAP
jgi:PAS domain S-box-containing protein